MADEIVEVAVAVIVKPDGQFLLTQRPLGKPYAGYWEFPGGKVEPNEAVRHALLRELHEELGVDLVTAYPWLTQVFAYPHATVRLRFFRVTAWHGEPQGLEGQHLAWQRSEQLEVAPLLPANATILRALALPPVYGISHAAELGAEVFMRRLEQALASGLRLVQVREKNLLPGELRVLAQHVVALAQRYEARVLINGDVELAHTVGADGVHLPAAQLMALTHRPDTLLCAASCHNLAELRHAEELGLDFAVLGPVQPTPSHPDAEYLGWRAFRASIADCGLPVYALGGMSANDLETAWRHGAHGVAMMRGAW